MATAGGPNTIEDGLVLYLDTGNEKSYKGEPTTNLVAIPTLSGMSGITLTYLGQDNGWEKYSMSGTFTGGTYPYIMLIDGVNFTAGVQYTAKCTLRTNVPYKFNYFGTSTISYVNQPLSAAGTSKVVTNSDGSVTVSREGFAYQSTTTQTGYLFTNPINNTTFNSSTDFVWIKDVQVEQKSHATPYTTGTRSATQGLVPLVGNLAVDLTNVSFDSNAKIVYDGTNDYIESTANLSTLQNITSGTVELVFKWNGSTSYNVLLHLFAGASYYGTTVGLGDWTGAYPDESIFFLVNNDSGTDLTGQTYYRNGNYTYRDGLYHHLVITTNGSIVQMYLDGNQLSLTSTSSSKFSPPTVTKLQIGKRDYGGGTGFHTGEIPLVKIYNKALSAQEVTQNYNALKGRFGL